MTPTSTNFKVRKSEFGHVGTFYCMASDCEILVDTQRFELAQAITHEVAKEARRIESKFSRYDSRSVIGKINSANGNLTVTDTETANLLDFANTLYELSEGAFDITTGSLGKLWRFNGSDQVPDAKLVSKHMSFVGWHKASWNSPQLTLPRGMSIDFGGIGKEYAVDKAYDIACQMTDAALLINFGGDLRANAAPMKLGVWSVGMNPSKNDKTTIIGLKSGALATSGDAKRYLLKNGCRYSHILDARTGSSVINAPTSVTVSGPTCIEAGMLATLASLQGANAEEFLKAQDVRYWISDGFGSNASFA